jgi:hypothetical protein
LTSTTDFTTKQMSEYMDSVEHEVAKQGIILPQGMEEQE